MQVDNQSPWAVDAMPMWTAERKFQPILVVKTGFHWDENGHLQPLRADDIPLESTERFHDDDPEQRSLVAAADVVPFKAGFELLVFGTAQASKPIEAFEVEVQWFNATHHSIWTKCLLITGPSHWQCGFLGWLPSRPELIEMLPLHYEYAFGGRHPDKQDKVNRYNPIGLGQHPASGSALPQIQQRPLITRRHQRPNPAGFGPIATHWEPRQARFKQMDAMAAESGQCPYPWVLDRKLYNAAPEDQQFVQVPDEKGSLRLKNFAFNSPEQVIQLPLTSPKAVLSDGQPIELTWDTLIIDADKQQLFQVWRGRAPVSVKDLISAQARVFDPAWQQSDDSHYQQEADA